VVWSLDTLGAGVTGTRSFTVTVNDLGASEPGFRQTFATLQDTGIPQMTSRASAVTVVTPTAPALDLAITGTPDPVQQGLNCNYTVTVTNVSTGPLTTVLLRLKLPVGSDGLNCAVDGGTLREGGGCDPAALYEWNLGTLSAGEQRIVRPRIRIANV